MVSTQVATRLCPRELFEQFGRDGFAISSPATSLQRLSSSITNGACMEPVLFAGDVLFYEEGAEPQDGDIVVFDVKPEIVEHARASSATAKAWEQAWGQQWPTRQAKLVKLFAGEQWIVCNESMARRTQYAERIIGVVRHIHRAGAPVHCSGIEAGAATDIGAVDVSSDSYNFPSATGVQDRTFTAFDYQNTTADTIDVEITTTGQRRLTTPSGLSGTADGVSWVSTYNVTTSTLVSTTQDYATPQIEDQPASSSRQYTESIAFTVSVATGHTIRFTPYFRVYLNVGSTGTTNVVTTAYSMRITSVKR